MRADRHASRAAAASGACDRPTASRRPTAPTRPACSASGRRAAGRRRSRRRGRRSWGSPRPRCRAPARPRRRSARPRSASCSVGRWLRRLVSSSDHVVNAWCATSSAPRLARMRPAPPKWSGCECVTITVWTSPSVKPGGLEPRLERLPRLRTGQAGVDDGEAAVVEEAVHVHVPEARHPDRQLHPDHARRDLGDLVGRGLLLLLGPVAAEFGISAASVIPLDTTGVRRGAPPDALTVFDASDASSAALRNSANTSSTPAANDVEVGERRRGRRAARRAASTKYAGIARSRGRGSATRHQQVHLDDPRTR